ncbi:MAG TPA: S9 family peptidase, partial [Prevotella sp.]|nr:S9 family peptidase [Candidatus Segatella violae]
MNRIVLSSVLAMSAMTMMNPASLMAQSHSGQKTGQTLKYPAAPKDNTVDEYFGVKVADPFRPLEDDTCAATAAWVKAENAVTDAYMAKIPQRAKYLKRLKQVANYEKVYTPFEKNGKWYVYKN